MLFFTRAVPTLPEPDTAIEIWVCQPPLNVQQSPSNQQNMPQASTGPNNPEETKSAASEESNNEALPERLTI